MTTSGHIVLFAALLLGGCADREPNLESSLLERIASEHSPRRTLSPSQARDALYGTVATTSNDSVYCIYTGLAVRIEPGLDPSKSASSHGFTTEHVYPQSKGSGQAAANTDLHHLFPAVDWANRSRDNAPFSDIPFETADKWLCRHGAWDDPHSQVESAFSLVRGGYDQAFEPMDASKGDVARAVFYFYAVYRDQADREDPNFFRRQKDVLLDWHRMDPPDQHELTRNDRIFEIQGNRNPFVDDTALVWMAFFADEANGLLAGAHASSDSGDYWICELHYDNKGTDENEGFGVCGPTGESLEGLQVWFYNGANGLVYDQPIDLGGRLADDGDGVGVVWFEKEGIQNGPKDGLALVNSTREVLDFVCYEGVVRANDGPAQAKLCEEIPLREDSKTGPAERLIRESKEGLWRRSVIGKE